jgi:hypothetical protein
MAEANCPRCDESPELEFAPELPVLTRGSIINTLDGGNAPAAGALPEALLVFAEADFEASGTARVALDHSRYANTAVVINTPPAISFFIRQHSPLKDLCTTPASVIPAKAGIHRR